MRKKIRVIRQLSAIECGSACIAMMLSYYGRHTTLNQSRLIAEPGRDGLSGLAVLGALQKEGLESAALKLSSEEIQSQHLPAIVFWNHNHWVVLESRTESSFSIIDPAHGRKSIKIADFSRQYSGVLVWSRPSGEFKIRPAGKEYSSWNYFINLLKREDAERLGLAILLSFVLQAIGVFPAALTAIFVDTIIPSSLSELMLVAALAIVVAVVTRGLISLVRQWVLLRTQKQLDIRSASSFFVHMLSLPYSYFQQRSTGDLLLRLSSNGVIRDIMTSQFMVLCMDGPLAIGYLILIALASPSYATLVLVLALMQGAGIWYSMRRQKELSQQMLAARSEEQSSAVETLNGIAYIKASAAEERMFHRWQDLFRKQTEVSYESGMFAARLDLFIGGLKYASPLVLLWYGTYLVINGHLTTGQMLAANALAAGVMLPLVSLMHVAQQLQMAAVYLERVMDVLQTPSERLLCKNENRISVSGDISERDNSSLHIECCSAGFRYDGSTKNILNDINLSISYGSKTAIVGPTGSGKTTLGMMLTGLISASDGSVLHHGIILGDTDIRDIRTKCGIVMQDPQLFSGTIRQNIALRMPDADEDDILSAAHSAGLSNDLSQMPMGLDTYVGERGMSLSGGQRQRIAIARALLNKPSLLLLDEATSHLDAETEKMINDSISDMKCTRIIIAHRISTIQDADTIIVMNRGRVEASGSPEQLMAVSDTWMRMISSADYSSHIVQYNMQ